ncbi:MAG TPA: PorP/SprF family type IX secretion system membrane protein [Chitinophagaceae bacterium]
MKTIRIYVKISIVITLCILKYSSNAQDLHFSQYFNSPLLVNPANTGFAPDVDWRVGINYRNQWASITPNPYKTMSVWGDLQLFNNRFENGWVGVGGSLLKDAAGSGGLTATRGFASVAYHQLVGLNSLVSGGLNVGFVNKRIDLNKLTFDNQWNGKFFDIKFPSGEAFATDRRTYLDLQAGLNYAIFPTDNTYINAGVSAMHLNKPTESFFTGSEYSQVVPVRYTVFLNGVFKLNDRWIVTPNTYISKMGPAMEFEIGALANYNLSGDGTTQLLGGLYYRAGDAFAPAIGFQLNNMKLTFSYDATTSDLGKYNATRGAYEFSIVKTGVFSQGRGIKCNMPSF